MHFVIYGTGGVGGYFGVRLAQYGNKVTFIARGKHLEVIKKNGLFLKSYLGDYHLKDVSATSDINDVKDIDVLLVCVKTWQLEEVSKTIANSIHNDTMVISLLNGVENHEKLLKYIPKKNVLGGLCKVVSKIEEYGVIHHMSYEPTIVFGELDNSLTNRAGKLKDILEAAKIKTILSNHILTEIWTKFLFITTISAIGALTRVSIGEMLQSPFIKKIMRETAREIVAIAKAKGIHLSEELIEKQFKIIESQPFDTTSSLQRDVLQGKPSELASQNGTVVRLGDELGIETPTNDFIYYCLLPQERKARA